MKDTLDNESLIQEMVRDAKREGIPSDVNSVIHKGDSTLEAPMVVKKISELGYVYVWDTRTYEKIPILYYMLSGKLKQKRPDGSYRFTTKDPNKEPRHGVIKCMLHADYKDREHFNDLGFRTCQKDNITNQYQLEMHMKKKHPQEWATIKDEIAKKEKEEDRELQRLILRGQVKESAPLYVKDKKL